MTGKRQKNIKSSKNSLLASKIKYLFPIRVFIIEFWCVAFLSPPGYNLKLLAFCQGPTLYILPNCPSIQITSIFHLFPPHQI